MESGEERRRQQVDLQLQSDHQLEESNRLAARVATAKSLLRLAVDRKNVYSDYLESVVTSVGGQYKDVISLMERCQALVIARSLLFLYSPWWNTYFRDKLKDRLQILNVKIDQEHRELEKFKEQKMEQTLDYNVR